jgi:hypothetical protein
MKPQKPLRALHGAQIREAQNMKQFMFCVPTQVSPALYQSIHPLPQHVVDAVGDRGGFAWIGIGLCGGTGQSQPLIQFG